LISFKWLKIQNVLKQVIFKTPGFLSIKTQFLTDIKKY